MLRNITRRCHAKALASQSGLTLIEIMVSIVILGILSTVGVPSFLTMIKNNRLSTQASVISSSIRFARSEAIKRNDTVALVSKGDSGSWSEGWDVVVDPDDTNVVIREVAALEGGNKLTCVADCTLIELSGNGTAVNSQSLRLCDDRNKGRLFTIRLSGGMKSDSENHGCE